MRYTSRGMRRRRDMDKWEVTLSHKDPITGERMTSYRTVEAKTERQAEKKRDELIMELERKGAAAGSKLLVTEFLDMFLDYKEKAAIVEPSTIRGYRHEVKLVCKYIGDVRLGELRIAEVNEFMAHMTADGYSPKSVAGCFRLLKQALKWAVAQDMLTKNPCDFCKPPKRVKTPINTLNTYADVDPDAKRAAVSKVEDAFDVDMSSIVGKTVEEEPTLPSAQLGLLFTADQLEVMLGEARKREREAV